MGRNRGGAEAGNGKRENKKANDVVFHDISPWQIFFRFSKFFAGQTNWLQHKVYKAVSP